MTDPVKHRVAAMLIMAIFMAPGLSFLNLKDIMPIAGFQQVEPQQELSPATFRTRQYQLAAERRFAKCFYLRGLMYRLRCQAMELPNLGVFHEGNGQDIWQFADGSLFMYRQYFNQYYDPACGVSEAGVSNALCSIARLQNTLASNGVDMVFVMATDKFQMTKSPPPALASALFKRRRDEFQAEYGALLAGRGIRHFDSYSFLTNEAPRHAEHMFPYAGIHWNALAASLVANELLERLNRLPGRSYAVNPFIDVNETDARPAAYQDEDIGLLLNLLRNPYLRRNKCYLPKFRHEVFTPNEGGLIVFGDSFSWQLAESFRRSGEFAPHKILVCDKRVPSEKELERVFPNLRLVLFVYMPNNMLALDGDARVGGNIAPFCDLLAGRFMARQIPIGKQVIFYPGEEQGRRYFITGLSNVEMRWTWTAGHQAVMRFFTASDAPELSVRINCDSFHHPQHVAIAVNGETAFDGVCDDGGLEFTFENPGSGKDVELRFHFPDAVSPESLGISNDKRLLGLRLYSLVVSEHND